MERLSSGTPMGVHAEPVKKRTADELLIAAHDLYKRHEYKHAMCLCLDAVIAEERFRHIR